MSTKQKLVRYALVGPGKNRIFVFDRADTPLTHASKCKRTGQRLVLATITYQVPK